MLGWFRALLPREDRFFVLLDRHAQLIVAGAEALSALLAGGPEVKVHCRRIVEVEAEADLVTRDVLLALRKTFITPFDRGDIKDLIMAMDDAVDAMQKAAKTITRFEQTQFAPEMAETGRLVVAAARLVADAIPLLARIGEHAGRLGQLTEEVVRLEGEADSAYDRGLDALFHQHRDGDTMAYLIGSEILDHLEAVADRLEDVANQINAVVIESV
jgi:predicted phosphate transport protein (TIGR00153 family)